MKRQIFAVAFAILGAQALPLAAQQSSGGDAAPTSDEVADWRKGIFNPGVKTIPYWKAELPGGQYLVKLAAIEAVSQQQYIVDGVARVTEVNIVTTGVFQPRFYYIERVSVQAPGGIPGAQAVLDHAADLADLAAKRGQSANDAAWTKVVKNYPTTTHAGTIEFRLQTIQQVHNLRQSVDRAWISGRGEIFRVEGSRPYTPDEARKIHEAPPEDDPKEN